MNECLLWTENKFEHLLFEICFVLQINDLRPIVATLFPRLCGNSVATSDVTETTAMAILPTLHAQLVLVGSINQLLEKNAWTDRIA